MARFIGGPLNGQSYTANEAASVASAFNDAYAPDEYLKDASGNYEFAIGGKLPDTGGPGFSGAHALTGWHDLRHSVNRSLPTSLQHSQAFRRAAARKLHRLHGVR